MNALEKLIHNVETIAGNYFLDTSELKVGNRTIESWNLTALSIAYILRQNILNIGEPGFGKTTAASIVGAACSGMPADLCRSVIIAGHPEQTWETMIGRPNYGKMHKGVEEAVWQKPLFLPTILLDEYNRLPQGKQIEFLDALATGRFGYLNDVYFDGEKAFFATANHQDGGNHAMPPPVLDRFALVLEFGYVGSVYRQTLRQFKKNVNERFSASGITTDFLKIVQNNDNDVKTKLEQISKLRSEWDKQDHGLVQLSKADEKEIADKIEAIALDEEADLFLGCLSDEMNLTSKYGFKRSCDPISDANHDKGLANVKCVNGFSPRGIEAIENYARAIAVIIGDEKVTIEHIKAIAPYAMAHRVKFTQDFYSEKADLPRTTTEEMRLARELVNIVEGNYNRISNDLKILYNANRGVAEGIDIGKAISNGLSSKDSKQQYKHLKNMLEDAAAGKLDYPTQKDYAARIIETEEGKKIIDKV